MEDTDITNQLPPSKRMELEKSRSTPSLSESLKISVPIRNLSNTSFAGTPTNKKVYYEIGSQGSPKVKSKFSTDEQTMDYLINKGEAL
jgi:hypothetical protein